MKGWKVVSRYFDNGKCDAKTEKITFEGDLPENTFKSTEEFDLYEDFFESAYDAYRFARNVDKNV